MINEYLAYGHLLRSEIELPLIPAYLKPYSVSEIQIRKASLSIDRATLTQNLGSIEFEITDERREFFIPGIASYRLSGDDTILVDPDESADTHLVGLYLVHLVLIFLVKNNDLEMFHGSAVSLPEDLGAVIFLGEKGVGKSTIAGALTTCDCKILCDDIIPVTSGHIVNPGVPLIKLCGDSYQELAGNTEDAIEFMDGSGKYQARMPHRMEPELLKMVCFLEKGNTPSIKISQVRGAQKVQMLLKHLIIIPGMNHDRSIFDQVTRAGQRIPMCRVIRPEGFIPPEELAEAVLKYIGKELDR